MGKKLTKCKTCGADIAKDAKTCPKCGAKNKVLHPVRGAVAGLIALIFCAVLISALGSSGESGGQGYSDSDKSSSVTVDIKVSAVELWKAYEENKVNADTLYKDKVLAVTGTISDITQDVVTNLPCVTLETGDSFGLYPIQCFFDSNQDDIISSLQDGQLVTVVGTCSGAPVIHVQLADCRI